MYNFQNSVLLHSLHKESRSQNVSGRNLICSAVT